MKVFVLILIFIGIALVDIKGLFRKKLWGELIIFFILLFIGFALNFLQVIEVKVPDPNNGIEFLIKQIF